MAYHLKTRIAIAVSCLTLGFLILLSWVALVYFEKEFKAKTFDYIADSLSITADNLSNRANQAMHALEIISNSIPPDIVDDPTKMQEFLDGLNSELLVFDNGLILFSPEGQLLAVNPYQEDVIGMDFSFRDYIKITLLNRQPFISAPFKSRQKHQHPIIMLTEPVFNEQDEIVAILGGSFDLYSNIFLQALVGNKVGKDGYYIILDQQETMLVHPDRNKILQPASQFLPREQIVDFLLNHHGNIKSTMIGGKQMIGAFRHVSPFNWTLLALTSLDESYQPIQKARIYTVFALIILSIFTVIAVRILTNRLTAPLINLTENIRLQTEGKKTTLSLDTSQYLELGDLANSIKSLMADVSAKRKDLKSQLYFLQNMIDTVPGPIFYKDKEYRYLGCNKTFEEYIGIPRDELIGKSVFDIAPPDLAKVYHQADVDLWEQGGKQVYEASVKYADGSLHDVIYYKKIFKDIDGEPAGMVGVFLDITDRKLSEQALQASERRFRLLVDNAADAFYLFDEDGQILDVNQHACTSLGYKRDELLKMQFLDLSGDYTPKAFTKLQDLLRGGGILSIEDHHNRKDGVLFPVEVRLCHTEQEGGLVIALARDMSERKQSEEALQKALSDSQRAKEQLDNILSSTADGLVVTDHRKQITHINHVAEEMLNISASDIINQPFIMIFNEPELRDQASEFLNELAQGGRQLDFKLNLSGTRLPRIVQARSSMLRSETGKLTGVVTLLRDVTRERELDQIKNEFISTAAHEMRTPMSVIMGYIEMLTNSDEFGHFPAEKQQHFLLETYRKGEALSQIIDDLFDISRIEAGLPLALDKKDCDIHALVQNVFDHFRKGSKKHTFTLDLRDRSNISIDRNKMSQVFENLISNAIKYSPDGGEISIKSMMKENVLQLVIEDQGSGMTPDQLERVFDKFYRADSSNTAVSGLGLGMSIVKSIIEAHGGSIKVASTLGQGTRVSLEIPCQESC
jgi:two-component system NtrC family sensor kinase